MTLRTAKSAPTRSRVLYGRGPPTLNHRSNAEARIMKVPLPYNDKHIPVEIDDRNFAGALVSKVEEHRPAHSETWIKSRPP
jgi:hypothetical protein